ncbi:MAG TPA: cytochrome c oxidase assembly protein [Ktedonobacterales bacterium]|nr:cytochrome c oxidase assembly protein [Ktedonobacterales bacterium]
MEPGDQITPARAAAFWIGVGIAALALFTPMDLLGMNYMFSVHMTQHLFLSLAVPPLLIMGTPAWVYRRLFADRRSKRGLQFLTRPFVASIIFNGNIWLWHAPLLMFLIMAQPALHLLSGLLYLLTGLIFWWPLLGTPQQQQKPLSLGGKLAYLFFSDMPMMLLGAGLTFSRPLYSMPMGPHASMSISAGDQQLGGLLMWVVGGIFLYVVVGSSLFLKWMLAQERLEQEQEEAAALEQEASSPIETPGPSEPSRMKAEKSSA